MPRVKASQKKTPAKKAPVRGKPPAPWRRWALGVAAGLVALGGVAGAITWMWESGVVGRVAQDLRDGAYQLTADAGLAIGDVFVEGRRETDRHAILAFLNVSRGDPILRFSPERARRDLERLAWVKEAWVERRLPDTIFVRLVERVPMALWQREGKLTVIDVDGVVLTDQGLARFSGLPMIIGSDAPEQAPRFLAILSATPAIADRVHAVSRVGGRRWNLTLDNDIVVKLPESGEAEALHTLSEIETTDSIFSRDVRTIDLRLPGQMTIETRDLVVRPVAKPSERI